MKNKLILLFALTVLASTTQAQTSPVLLPNVYDLYQPVLRMNNQSTVVYTHTNGIQNIFPSYELTPSLWGNGFSVYNYSNGFRDILPSYEYRSVVPGIYNGYNTINGISNILPSNTIYLPPITPLY